MILSGISLTQSSGDFFSALLSAAAALPQAMFFCLNSFSAFALASALSRRAYSAISAS